MKAAAFILSLLLALHAASSAHADLRPILQTYCLGCHSTAEQKGELDLEASDIHRQPHIWEDVLDQLTLGEMPPKDEKQLPPSEKQQLITSIRRTLDQIALASAGDPGPVILRRLSNMEYTYTLRDLTGIDTLDPAREFPVDGAAGEGFSNAGAALVMSPALLTKYLDAAKEVTSHAIFTPHGMRWSASTTARDWTDETLTAIRQFYARYTAQTGAQSMNLQGVKFDTNAGGRLPLNTYLDALQGRHDGAGLSTKYLRILRQALTSTQPSILLDPLRAKYRQKQLTAADIEPWQQILWRFATIGHIGKENGPKGWQEPLTPLATQHELRLKLTPPKNSTALKLYLTATDAGDGSEGDAAFWQNARIVVKGKPDHKVLDLAITKTPQVIELSLPAAQIVLGAEFVISAKHNAGSVQVQILTEPPKSLSGLQSGYAAALTTKGQWSDNNLRTTHSAPILVADDSPAKKRLTAAFDDFRALFPIALCYTKIVPVDEVVTLTLFFREDSELKRLILTEAETAALDRLWDQLLFVSEAPLKQVDAFEQLYQFATQDAKPSAFEPMRQPILQAAAAFKTQQKNTIPTQQQAVLDFAAKAWRRPLTEKEITSLRAFSPQLMLIRVLTAPAFLYRIEKTPPKTAPISCEELATRLSYFLWSSAPDTALRSADLHDPQILTAQIQRMLRSPKIRRLALEFGCQWLHIRDLDTLEEKSQRHFPTFLSLRPHMQEEVTRFITDLIQNNRSALSLLDADHTFLNEPLATHYGLPLPPTALHQPPSTWFRIDGLQQRGRGGILGFAATLARHSGASRTSAILRGTWLSEVILGDKLPTPPKGVPTLPEEAPADLTERQLIERHSRDTNCIGCHKRIDPYGFALEGFDAIGRTRTADTRTHLPDGTAIGGLADLRTHLLTTRRSDFLRHFSRKLLGYALGRSIQLSDKPLLDTMVTSDLHLHTLITHIIRSPQFQQIRGQNP
ncbi:MAG: DUF1592 domain-containing protein [Verrucomicrobiaceae bacterium]|nr:DUF1592 domain-containing protein [Verrucomicrobiaceae bacterium]